jgi:N-acyl-D-amino-acid deacylase
MPDAFTIRNALIYDGTGTEPAEGDVGIVDGIIAERQVEGPDIEARGMALCPGFIDSHSHDDQAVIATDLAPKISQGITTVVTGHGGISLAPLIRGSPPPPPLNLLGGRDVYCYAAFADLLARISRLGSAVNVASLVGHTTLRVATLDRLDREATLGEIEIMKARLRESLEAGAIGLSSGLDHAPASSASLAEIEALVAVCGAVGAIHVSHLRGDDPDTLAETLAMGRRTDVPIVISHHKCTGANLAQIAGAQGPQEVGLVAYPYEASSSVLRLEFLRGAKSALVTWSEKVPKAAGHTLAELARSWKIPLDKAVDRLSPGGAVYFDMDESDVRRVLGFPASMIGSAGFPDDIHPHPGLWGSFPRVLGHYARDAGLFSLTEAIRKMTSLPARRFGLSHRGRIAPGYAADLVLFDPATIKDEATFAEPKRPARGIVKVWVNGTVVWEQGKAAGPRPGKLLRRQPIGSRRDN